MIRLFSMMSENYVIDTKLGKIRGKLASNYLGVKYYSFQGIPYARAPVGSLRFKAPLPAEAWNGVLDGTKEGPACPSFLLFDWVIGNEDNCLNLNVYIKELPKNGVPLKPVMVWIHGGGFTRGSNSSKLNGPGYLMTEDVILVTINYRLGVLGFICLEDEHLGVTGNAGLKDQVMALKWVRENIISFGGDPNNVTVFGQSAGGASVHFLTLSPLAKGLFHKVIIQSGSALNSWASGVRGVKHICEYMKTEENDEFKILNILQNMTVKELLSIQKNIPDRILAGFQRFFAPVVEKPSKDAFIYEEPEHLLKSGNYNKVPIIIGTTSNEAVFHRGARVFEGLRWSFDCKLEIPLDLRKELSEKEEAEVVEKICNFYKLPADVCEESSFELKSDNLFVHGCHRSMNYHIETNNNPIFCYKFSFEGSMNHFKNISLAHYPRTYILCMYLATMLGTGFMRSMLMKIAYSVGFKEISGSAHGDELSYLFGSIFSRQMEPNSSEENIMKRLVKLWTNFAKHSNPTPENNEDELGIRWIPIEQNKHHYLDIGDELTMKMNPFSERNKFWNDIYDEYSKK
ncbi:hypothetical protein WA026_007861 [Henosepilachna vigintioctopunctata]|uniref:Carboxylic ester hydrolase n=1 Tax=Henosepilachna vigintioctopunctata TaxID=420089 RepID=A0AAW1U483_9CUCU